MYSIKDLAMMTGLTDRTLRSYLSSGVLRGEKQDGAWTFTDEQFCEFLQHETVRPSLQAKRNAIVFDFMANTWRRENAACIILDLPTEDPDALREFVCEAVNRREGMRMSYHHKDGQTRILLSGREQDVYDVWSEYHLLPK